MVPQGKCKAGMIAHLAAATFYAAGAIALAAIIHTIRTTAPAVRKLLDDARKLKGE